MEDDDYDEDSENFDVEENEEDLLLGNHSDDHDLLQFDSG